MNAEQKQRAKDVLTNWIADEMAALLQELIDAPEPEQPNQSEQHLEMVNAPEPSVPDEQLQSAFDRGLKAGNEQAIAQQIEIHKLHDLLAVQQPEQSDDQVRGSERYRWLRDSVGEHWDVAIRALVGVGAPAEVDAAIDAAIEREKKGGAA